MLSLEPKQKRKKNKKSKAAKNSTQVMEPNNLTDIEKTRVVQKMQNNKQQLLGPTQKLSLRVDCQPDKVIKLESFCFLVKALSNGLIVCQDDNDTRTFFKSENQSVFARVPKQPKLTDICGHENLIVSISPAKLLFVHKKSELTKPFRVFKT